MKEKIIKYAYYVRGFMRMSTMIILLILLVTYYFYQDKVKEISKQLIADNRENGALFYAEGIWGKMKGVQKMQEDRNQSAYDLTGDTKVVGDKNGLYSFEVPQSWDVVTRQGGVGGQLSEIVVTNKSFLQRKVGNDVFYDNGAQLTVQVFSGERADAKSSDGGHGKLLIGKNNVEIGGADLPYHKIINPQVKNGDIIDAHVLRGGNTFEIRYVYNQEKLNGGEFLFQTMMNSFKFNDKK